MATVDEDIRRLIDRAIDPEFVGRLVADPEGVIRANGWTIAPDRLVDALRSAGVAPAEVEVLQSRISYSGIGRLVGTAIHMGHDAHAGSSVDSSASTSTSSSADQAHSAVQSASTDLTARSDPLASGTAPQDATPTAEDPDSTDGSAVPFAMDDGTKGMKAAPVDGVPDESGD